MTRTRRELDALLDRTVDEMRQDLPADRAFAEAADRARERLSAHLDAPRDSVGTDAADPPEPIRSCDDVRSMLGPYTAGELAEGRGLLIEDHTRECLPCRRALIATREGRAPAETAQPAGETGWSLASDEAVEREAAQSGDGKPSRWALALAATLVVALGLAVLAAMGLLGSPSPLGGSAAMASVESIDGALFLVTEEGNRRLHAGDSVERGREMRTTKGAGAVIRLADGSRVELAERTEMAVRTGALLGRGDTTLDLGQGRLIVEAAKRSRGELFVDTEDCRVAVTGTIFAVNHGTKGSRVSVIEGAVRVEQGRREDMLRPGDQVTTRASLTAVPVAEEIAWSRDLDRYLALLAELNALQDEIRQAVDTPLPRTSTRLLDLAPAGTTLYAAVPNVAESMGDAHRVLSERLETSPVLREALGETGSLEHREELGRLIDRIRDFGGFLGEEVVFAMVGDPESARDNDGAVAFAEVLDPYAFRAFLEQEIERFRADEPEADIVLVDDPGSVQANPRDGLYLWPTDGLVVASIGPGGLARMAASLDPSAPGEGSLAGSPFHALLTDAYAEGVEWLLAADLDALIHADRAGGVDPDAYGFEDARHLLVRWSESGERPGGRAVLAFDGPRRGVASWLAAPAPMGSLEFVTADAAAAAAFVVRDPLKLVDEMLAILLQRDPEALADLERIEREHGFDLRQDLAAPLGGEFAFALDGPLAPKPSFKAVLEVYDPVRLQQTLEWAVERLNAEAASRPDLEDGFALTAQEQGGRTIWAVSTPAEGVSVYYTFVDSYLVAAPSPALLDTAIRARQTGANLLASGRFRELLPADGFTNFSALLYQDLGSRFGSLADALAADDGRELSPEERATLEQAGELRPPTLGYAYGLEDRLVFAASVGGEGMLPLSALLGAGGDLRGLAGPSGLLGLFGPTTDPSDRGESSAEDVEGGP